MSKGSQTTSTQTSPPGYVQNAYQGLISNTGQLAQTPYTPYTGEGVAPVNQQQYQGIGNINQYALAAQPSYEQALGLVSGAANPLTAGQIQNYYDPYQQQVIGTTEQQFNEMNKMALNNIQGSAVAQGALGGNRDAVAQAAYYQGVLPGQEQAIAGLEAQGYNQALSTAAQQYQQNPMAAAYGLGNLGAGAQNAALQGAGAQMSAGTLQQQTQQALDQYLYNQYLAQQGYPFALNQYAAGIDTGVGSLAGGTGTTTGPPPSSGGAIAGGLEAALGAGMMFLPGGQVPGMMMMGSGVGTAARAGGGPVKGYALGGSPVMPYAGAPSYIPSASGLAHGSGPPRPPQPPGQSPSSLGGGGDMFGKAMNMAKMAQSVNPGDAPAVSALGPLYQHGGRTNYPGGLALPTHGRINLPMRGGMGMPSFVHGYQEGGSPSDSLFSPDYGKMYLAQQEAQAAYGNPVTTTAVPASQIAGDPIEGDVSTSPAGVAGDISGDLPGRVPTSYEVPAGQRADASAPAGLAYAPEHAPPGGGVYAPAGGVGGGYQLPPRLPPSERPSLLPSGRELGFALMDAGFRTMAAASRPGATTLGAIGEGGVGGLHTYAGLKQGEANIEMESRKLDQQAQAESDRIKHEGETIDISRQREARESMMPHLLGQRMIYSPEGYPIRSEQVYGRWDPNRKAYIDPTGKPVDLSSLNNAQTAPETTVPSAPTWGKGQPIPYGPKIPPLPLPPGMQSGGTPPTSWMSSVSAGAPSSDQSGEPQGRIQVASDDPNFVPKSNPETFAPPDMSVGDEDSAAGLRSVYAHDQASTEGLDQDALAALKNHPMVKNNPGLFNRTLAVATGRAPLPPTGRATLIDPKTGAVNPNQFIANQAYALNPLLDQTTFQRRQRTENFYAVGNQSGGGQNIVAINRWLAHSSNLLGLAEKLNMGDYTTWNDIRIALAKRGYGAKETQDLLGAWDVNAKGVSGEAAKAFAGTGQTALTDREEWEKILNPDTPLHTIRAKLAQAAEMGEQALGANIANYNEGLRTNHSPREFLTPQNRARIDAMKQGRTVQPATSGVDPRDAAALKANANNPAAVAAVDKKYGVGTAARLLGAQ